MAWQRAIVAVERAILFLVLLRFVVGAFWFEHSYEKWGWFETGELQRRLLRYAESATGLQQMYLENFCLPLWGVLQYLVVFGELAVGLSFLIGALTRAAAVGGAFLALNFLFAQGGLFTWGLIGNPYGPVTIMATIAAAYGGGESLWSLSWWVTQRR